MVEQIAERLVGLADRLDQAAARLDLAPLDRLAEAADDAGKAWSGSWLGYHSRVYYRDLQPVPSGVHFSVECGFDNTFGQGTGGDWVEFEFESVVKTIAARAGGVNLDEYSALSMEVSEELDETQAEVLSMLSAALREIGDDSFLSDINKSVKEVKPLRARAIIDHLSPSGQILTRDMAAVEEGRKPPPHIWVIARTTEIRSPFTHCAKLSKLARRAAAHLGVARRQPVSELASGSKIFIGHGHSAVWKDLKDFFQDRLGFAVG